MPLGDVCEAIEMSRLGLAIDSSPFWWPAIETTHLLALVLLVGSITAFDVRLLGLALKRIPVSKLGRRLLPVTWSAFAVSLITGSLLFASEAQRKYCFNQAFRIKLLLIVLAGLNMAVFHFTIYRSGMKWDDSAVTPAWAKVIGSVSTLLWLGVIIAGRWIGFAATG